jgi:hypothetical protein
MCKNELMDGRPTEPFYETRTWGLRRGIVLVDEEFWQVQRRFIAKHLKNFGFARRGMAEIIENETEFCMNDILQDINLQGAQYCLMKMQKFFSLYVLNTLWQMMLPKLSGYTDFVDINNMIHKFIGKLVENHKKTFNINDEPRDLVGVYPRKHTKNY